MAKSLRDIIAKDDKSAGRNVPKGEADFLDAHKVEVTDYPVKQVKKDITHKAVDTKPEEDVQKNDPGMRHGYRKNQDVAAYNDTNEEVESVEEMKRSKEIERNRARRDVNAKLDKKIREKHKEKYGQMRKDMGTNDYETTKKLVGEESEEIDETKRRGYTKGNFANRKKESRQRIDYATRNSVAEPTRGPSKADMRREAEAAYKSFRKEEVESVEEMTGSEKDKREDIVKGMKKNFSSFKKRYGKDAEKVMYATATKQATK